MLGVEDEVHRPVMRGNVHYHCWFANYIPPLLFFVELVTEFDCRCLTGCVISGYIILLFSYYTRLLYFTFSVVSIYIILLFYIQCGFQIQYTLVQLLSAIMNFLSSLDQVCVNVVCNIVLQIQKSWHACFWCIVQRVFYIVSSFL